MNGAGTVLALVLLEWTVGWVGVAAWTQSWKVVRRGHFRITAWIIATLGILTLLAGRSAFGSGQAGERDVQMALVVVFAFASLLYLALQYRRSDTPGVIVGGAAVLVGAGAIAASGALLSGWGAPLAAAELLAGALLLGSVTNGMMLGHWYLNQPGLKPWALGRLTQLALVAAGLAGVLGIVAAGRLSAAETPGAVLGLPGFGDGFGFAFFVIWLTLLVFTGVAVAGARRCIRIRSIQSATGLYYVALLTAGVSEFLVRYLMVNVV